jgi:hypothetical protein
MLASDCCRVSARKEHSNRTLNQLFNHPRQLIVLASREAKIDDNILTFDITIFD